MRKHSPVLCIGVVASVALFAVANAAHSQDKAIKIGGLFVSIFIGFVGAIFGREMVVDEANRSLMDDLYRKAIEQEDLVPVGDPELDGIEPDPLQFTVIVPVYPTVDPGDYLSVRVEPADAALEDGAVDEVLDGLRKQQSPWVDPAEPRVAQEGDQITVDISIAENGEDVDEGRPVKVVYRWTKAGPNAARWEQAFSYDGGKSWETNWMNELTRE